MVEGGEIYLDYPQFLSQMPYCNADQLVTAYDLRHPQFYDSSAEPFYLLPSYLKQIEGVAIQRVWQEAGLALAQAKEVRVVGASLPNADSAVRALLNPLRFRLEDGSVSVSVHDPNKKVHLRWKGFLGSGVVALPLKTGDAP